MSDESDESDGRRVAETTRIEAVMRAAGYKTVDAQRTAETRQVEAALRAAGYATVDAYRFNAAAVRVRVVDARFTGHRKAARYAAVEPHLEALPERLQGDILMLVILTPDELAASAENAAFEART